MANGNVTSMNPAPFDPVRFTLELREILSRVTVSGPDNIHNMDLVLNGLVVLHNAIVEQRNKEKNAGEDNQEEI